MRLRAEVRFPPFSPFQRAPTPFASFQTLVRSNDGDEALRRSPYAQSWALAKRLMRESETPYDYLAAVNRYLQDGFTYDETPEPVPPGRATLDGFLFETKSGYCQHFSGAMALLLRMGGDPRPRRDGLLARRVLRAQGRVDRARHRRALLGRGLVRRVRLGRVRPDAGRDPGALADRGDRAAAGVGGRRRGRRLRRRGRRVGVALRRDAARPARAAVGPRRRGRRARPRRAAVRRGGRSRSAGLAVALLAAWALVRWRRRGAQPGPGARARGRRAGGGAAAHRPPGRRRASTLQQLEQRLGGPPEAAATCARCAPAATARPPRSRRGRRRRSAGAAARLWQRAAERGRRCAPCGRCRPGAGEPRTRRDRATCRDARRPPRAAQPASAARRDSWRISARMRSSRGSARRVDVRHRRGDGGVALGDQRVHLVGDRAVGRVALAAGAQLDQVHRLARVEVEHVADPVAEAERVGRGGGVAGVREPVVLGGGAVERGAVGVALARRRRPPPGTPAPRSGVSPCHWTVSIRWRCRSRKAP